MATIAQENPELIRAIQRHAHRLSDAADLDPLLKRIGDSRFVLLGEASHGTSEFYVWRARLSQRLIREKGFSFIAVEGDWPACYALNRFVKGYADAPSETRCAFDAFERWPTWMWGNWETVALAEWLRLHNQTLPRSRRAGFYGLDVYSLHESMTAVIEYLERVDPPAAVSARQAYACFAPYGENGIRYARAAPFAPRTCEQEVLRILAQLQARRHLYNHDIEGPFNAEQNALVAANAEHYYRSMIAGDAHSWNVRDRHMMETLDRLMAHHAALADQPGPPKAIVWAHNTHIGDARATDMAAEGMLNIGQLARELHGSESATLVGFGTQRGTVIAGEAWDAPMERMPVPPARPGSWEALLHGAEVGDCLLLFDEMRHVAPLRETRGHRAIGVVYNPRAERGNYVPTDLPARYDAFIHIEETGALHPLALEPHIEEPPDTYPWGV